MMATTIPGQRVIDPNVEGFYGVTDALQLSGLTIARAAVGEPVSVVFTATSTPVGLGGGVLWNACDTIMGLVTTSDGTIIIKLNAADICVGPYGSGVLRTGQYEAVGLSSSLPLPQEVNGSPLAGQIIYAYVGPYSLLSAWQEGGIFVPDLNVMLVATTTVAAGATPPESTSPSSSSSSSSGTVPTGTTTSSSSSSASTSSSSASPSTSSGAPPSTASGATSPAQGFWSSLTTTQKALLIGGGVALLGGAAFVAWETTKP